MGTTNTNTISSSIGSSTGFGVSGAGLVGVAQRMIKKFGSRCTFRRETAQGSGVWVDRPCYAAFTDWSPLERAGQLIDPLDRLVLVSTEGLMVAPNQHLDLLVTWDYVTNPGTPAVLEQLKMSRPPGRLSPSVGPVNTGVIYWELHVRGMRGVGATS
jgi:hypothetical protein